MSTTQSSKLNVIPTYWLVRIKKCEYIKRPENSSEGEDPENGMVLGGNDDMDEEEEDDLLVDFRVSSVRSNKPKKKLITLQCPQRELVLETNAFVWPYPVWMTVRIEVHTNVIAPPDHVIAESLQKGRFTPLEYFVTDWLVSKDASSKSSSIDLSGGLGNVYGVPLFSQFLSLLRPQMKGNSEIELFEVQSYERHKISFCDYLNTRRDSNVRLNDMTALLSEYVKGTNLDESESASRKQVYSFLHQQIISTDEGHLLQMSSDAPDFFRLGPLLFPRKICNLMIRPSEDSASVASSKTQLFKVLDDIILSEPWKLGFSSLIYKIVQHRCTGKKWSGLEAHLRHIKKATFYHDLNKEQKDALHVYDTIKVISNFNPIYSDTLNKITENTNPILILM